MLIEQHEDFANVAEDGTKIVCVSKKSIYGLKQASKNWYDCLKNNLLDENFQQSKNNYCLCVKREDYSLKNILVWVDENILASFDHEQIKNLSKNSPRSSKWKKTQNLDGF